MNPFNSPWQRQAPPPVPNGGGNQANQDILVFTPPPNQASQRRNSSPSLQEAFYFLPPPPSGSHIDFHMQAATMPSQGPRGQIIADQFAPPAPRQPVACAHDPLVSRSEEGECRAGDRISAAFMDERDVEPPINGLPEQTGATFDPYDDPYVKEYDPYFAYTVRGDSVTRIYEVDDDGNPLLVDSADLVLEGNTYHPPDGPIKVDITLKGTRKPPKVWRKDFVKKSRLIALIARLCGKKLAAALTGTTEVPYCHFNNTVKLHQSVRYSRKRPPVAYDMRLDVEGTVRFVHLNRHIEFEDLAQYITGPPVYQMRLYHPLLPWYIDIRPNSGPGCVLGNLFAAIYVKLRKEIGKSDFYNNGLDDEEREEIIDAWFLRCGLEGGEAKAYAVRRVDFLKDQVIFEGLVKGKNGTWEMKTRSLTG